MHCAAEHERTHRLLGEKEAIAADFRDAQLKPWLVGGAVRVLATLMEKTLGSRHQDRVALLKRCRCVSVLLSQLIMLSEEIRLQKWMGLGGAGWGGVGWGGARWGGMG